MAPLIQAHLEDVQKLCRRHGVQRLFLFGSAATDGFDPARSDVDFLVVFDPNIRRSGLDDVSFALAADLESLLGCAVDLVEAHALRNPYFIASVNRTKRMLYAA